MTQHDERSSHAPEDAEELVAIGSVIKPHGVRGAIRVYTYNPDSKIWKKLKTLTLIDGDGATHEFQVTQCRVALKYIILTLAGCDSYEAADEMRRWEARVSRERFPHLQENEFYLIDLVGHNVLSEAGESLGKVTAILEYPAVNCLEVLGNDGIREVPLTRPWLVEMDEEAGEIIVAEWDDLPVRQS